MADFGVKTCDISLLDLPSRRKKEGDYRTDTNGRPILVKLGIIPLCLIACFTSGSESVMNGIATIYGVEGFCWGGLDLPWTSPDGAMGEHQ